MRLTFVYEACYGGTAWRDTIGGSGRIAIASSGSTETSLGIGGWPVFGHRFFEETYPQTGLGIAGNSVEAVFQDAYTYTRAQTANPQNPVMNDGITGSFTDW